MNKSLSAIVRGPFKHELELEVFHQGFGFNVVVEYFYTPEEKPTSDCPGSPEDFEIVFCGIENCTLESFPKKVFTDLLEDEFCSDDGYYDVSSMCEWFSGLEETIMKKFYEEIEADKKGDF